MRARGRLAAISPVAWSEAASAHLRFKRAPAALKSPEKASKANPNSRRNCGRGAELAADHRANQFQFVRAGLRGRRSAGTVA